MTTRTFANVTDDGLLFSNIAATETSVGTTNSMLGDATLGAFATVNTPLGAVAGLSWRGFVGGASGPGSSLQIELAYTVSALDALHGITAIRSNSFVPDTLIPAGATLSLRQEVRDADGNLIGVSQLTRTATTSDVQDPPFELGDLQLGAAYSTVSVRIVISVTIAPDAAPGTAVSFSAMTQTYNEGPAFAQLGDLVFEDLDADGVQDANEAGIQGVTVELLDGQGNVVATDVTDADGNYLFTVAPGTYAVRFVTPGGYVVSPANQGGDDALDSDINGSGLTAPVTLVAGNINRTVDAGLYRKVSLGDYVFEDLDADGVQDADEAGIDGVTVELLDANGQVVDSTVTANGGAYAFTGRDPGTYSVRFVTPAGYVPTLANQGSDDTRDSDAVGGATQQVTLTSGQHDGTLDAGFFRKAGLGDHVFEDRNGNGIQDAGDVGLVGVRVELLDANGAVVGATTTGPGGSYGFTGLQPGTYSVRFVTPDGFMPTLANQGGDDAKDSDAVGGVTQQVTIRSGEFNGTLDAGFVRKPVAISIEKTTNGTDGPTLLAGSAVTWTYTVRNTGSVEISNVAVSDDREGPVTNFVGGDTDNDGRLDVNEVWTYTKAGIAGAGVYENVGTVTGTYVDGLGGSTPVTDDDPSGYIGVTPGISIEKVTNGSDGGSYFAGSAITWTYTVRNTGTIELSNVTVSDDREGAVTNFLGGDADNDGRLDVNEVWTYTKTGIAGAGSYQNLGMVTATARDDAGNTRTVSASDPSGYTGITPGISIEKVTNGTDGPTLPVGSAITWTYTVRNTGNVELSNVAVSDDREGPVTNFVGGDTDNDGRLDVGEVWTYTKTGTAQLGSYTNLGTVTARATDSSGATRTVSDDDPSGYVGLGTPGIDIEKTTNGPSNANPVAPTYDNEDAANGAGVPILTPGTAVTWTYKVTNTGTTVMQRSEIAIVDDNGTPGSAADDMTVANGRIAYVSGDIGNDGLLSPGETWIYQATGTVKNLTTPGVSTTFDFSGSSALDGPDGNIRTYSSGGISVKASAFSRVDGANGAWSTAWLGAYGGGLGVTDKGEGSGGSDTHTVDNMGGRDNYVVFAFDQQVIVDKAYLGYVVGDSDISVWIGTISNAFSGTVTLNDAVLSGLGFTEVNDTTLSSARWADINAGNLAGNVLVIAASTADTTPDDRFKIEKLAVSKPASAGIYENKATVTAQGATDSDLSHYTNPGPRPGIDIEKLVSVDGGCTFVDADTATGPVLAQGTCPVFRFVVTNTGETTLTNVTVTDDRLDLNGSAAGTARVFARLDAGQTVTFEVAGTWESGQHVNLATVVGTYTPPGGGTGTTVTDSDAANYLGLGGVGVRTPGFWNQWRDFWDGDSSVPRQAGQPGFAAADILYGTYSKGVVDPVGGARKTGILVGDWDRDGVTDAGETTFYYSVSEAAAILDASNSTMGADARYILDRQLIASWLNYLAGNPVEDAARSSSVFDARDAIQQAITWLSRETPNENGVAGGDGNLVLNASAWAVPSSDAAWKNASDGIASGETIKNWLDEYNNTGCITYNGVKTQIALDGDLF